jgi:hypothetical protein
MTVALEIFIPSIADISRFGGLFHGNKAVPHGEIPPLPDC